MCFSECIYRRLLYKFVIYLLLIYFIYLYPLFYAHNSLKIIDDLIDRGKLIPTTLFR